MGTNGTSRKQAGLQPSLQPPIFNRVIEPEKNLEPHFAHWQVTAFGLHATLTGAGESNTAKVGIGGDDGHDERKDGE